MTKTPGIKTVTKKHLARVERERIQTRYIMLGSLVVLILVVLLIGYGILDEFVLKANRPVAKVGDLTITTREFQAQTRYARGQMILNYQQLAAYFGSDQNYYNQVAAQLQTEAMGRSVLDQLIADKIIRLEAARRGIVVSAEEVESAVREKGFRFYENGTPTPKPTEPTQPTATLSALQMTLVAPPASPVITTGITTTATLEALPTATATLGPTNTPTPGPSPTPRPTSTPYTVQGYQEQYKTSVDSWKSIGIPEDEYRKTFENDLYREKVMEAVLAEMVIPREEKEQVWARHILVSGEVTATQLIEQLNNGADFAALAKEYSSDTGSAVNGGDLGWFGTGQMVPEFEQAAFSLQVGEIVTQPVQSQYGYHIIQVLGRESQPITDSEYDNLREQKFQEWLDQKKQEMIANGQIIEYDWLAATPSEPVLAPYEGPQQQPLAP